MSPNRAWNNRQVPLSVGLRTAARLRPQAKALVSVDAGGDTCHDYAELDRRATRIACQLANMGGAGERALLLMDSGIDYVSAFYGCLYAGVIAVPVFPPESSRAQHIARLAKIAEDARVRFVLTTAALDARFGPQYRQLAPRAAIVSVDTLSVSDAAPDDFAPCDAGPDDVAFLQYTSGSTGQPKGVMVSHGNLVANQQALAAAWGASSADVYVSWLPLYHDMGLIGAMMQAFFSGMTLVLMSPQYFLAHPLRWLQAIDRHGGTLTGAPDFAYRLCADHIRPDTAASLDLSHLRIAYSGSEPVRKSTLEAFAARFAPAGFDPKALFPCYGLAEATLFVSGGLPGHGFTATVFGAAPLAAGQARAASPGEPGVPLVACGTAQAPHAIRIVDPRNGASMPAGSVGEIEVRGPSVTLGYWQRPDASADVFRDSRDGSAGQAVRWLRTGDLGFMHEGMLYVAARRKDLIIVRGRNLYPQDIEQTVEDTCDIVRKGRVAAFDAEVDGREGPGLAVEIPPLLRKRLSAAHIVEQLSRCVFDACGEAPSAIVLLNGGGLPKTSSGKVQRAAVRQGWRDRTLDAWAIWERGIFVHGGDGVRDVSHDRAAAAFNSEIEQTLAQLWREVLGTEPASRDTHFFAAGGSSLGAARLASLIGKRWARPADMGLVFEFPVFSAMALAVARLSQAVASPVEDDAVLADIPRANTGVTSHAQQRQLFAARLDPRGTAYHIAVALRLRGHLDTSALRQSLDHLVARHAALRMVFVEQRDTHVPEVRAASPHGWTCLALPDGVAATDADALDNAIAAASQRFAAAPFDLANGPLIRFGLLALDDDDHVLLIALHHIAADGWSMRLLIDDWAAHYRALATGEMLPPPAPDRPAYGDYAAWQRHWLRGAQAARQRAYWSAELAGMPPPAPLPYERTGTVPGGGAEAARIDFAVPAETFERLRTAATRAGTTPFVLALAAWHLWLHRMSGQADICTGVPVANRRNDAVRHIVGFFVNTLAIRSRCTSATCVASLVAELRRAVLDGLSHQELPFDVLVEHLNPERGTESIPLCQTLFNYLQDDYPSLRALPGLTASCREIAPGHAKTRLAMDLRESGGDTLRGFLTYVPAAFAAADAQRIVAQYRRALDGVVEALLGDMRGHDRPLADLDLLGRAETARIRHASQGEVIADVFEPVHRRFARHARMSPQAIAIVDGDVRLTYRQLDQRAEHIARWLAERGLAAEQRVAVIAERSWAFVAAMLGVLKAGGTYVPIDAATPPTRIAQLLRDCGAAGVLAERADSVGSVDGTDGEAGSCGIIAAIAGDGPSLSDGSCAEPDVDPRQAAYVIYTSGSTGTPKGVVVPHASLSNYAASLLSVCSPPRARRLRWSRRWRPTLGTRRCSARCAAAASCI